MTESDQLIEAMDNRVQRRNDRRDMFKMVLGTAAVGGAFAYANAAAAQTTSSTQQDIDVLNFALNLEYLEANFYSYAAFGQPIAATKATGSGTNGYAASATSSAGARAVAFQDPLVAQYAKEIAQDEIAHVDFLRAALNGIASNTAVAQPQIDVGTSPNGAFSSAARAAGLVGAGVSFDAYLNDNNFLLAAFIFEDVGVTAYKGASPLITNKTYLEAAAGILAVEAYHASIVRTVLYRKGIGTPASGTTPAVAAQPSLLTSAQAISDARDSLDGNTTAATPPPTADDDQGLTIAGDNTVSNIVPLDANGLAYSRTTGQVLNIVYLNPRMVTAGGFFPAGVNGNIKASTANIS